NAQLKFSRINEMTLRTGADWNYSYYPVIFEDETILLKVQQALNQNDIFPRRYFYPSLNTLKYVKSPKMKISEEISKRILCLPLYQDLKKSEIDLISAIINKVIS